jgi:hypothetical protein
MKKFFLHLKTDIVSNVPPSFRIVLSEDHPFAKGESFVICETSVSNPESILRKWFKADHRFLSWGE